MKGITVAEICDWYLAEPRPAAYSAAAVAPSRHRPLAMDKSRIEVHIKPLLGRRLIATLKLGDIEGRRQILPSAEHPNLARAVEAERPRAGKGWPRAPCRRCMPSLNTLFALERSTPIPRVAFVGLPERRGNAASAAAKSLVLGGHTFRCRGWRASDGVGCHPLPALTGFRRMEGLGVKRLWLNTEEGSVRFPDTKSGAQTRVIGRAAMDLLLGQPQHDIIVLLPGGLGEGHFIGVVRVLDRLCASAKLDDVTPHTLRHTFASVAADLGFSELTIAALLGHAARGETQRYIHIDEALRLAADRVADEIDGILDQSERAGISSRSEHWAEPIRLD